MDRALATHAKPLYDLLKKLVEFIWTELQQQAFELLKKALTSPPALMPLDYTVGAGEITLGTDASLTGWGADLGQIHNGKRHPARFESGVWNDAERNYDATKRECRAVLKALKKLRSYLYGVRFVLETDANVLVAQLNMSGTDLPGALITRWLAWIHLFDFDVRHVTGRVHTSADGLSRRPATLEDQEECDNCNLDSFIDAELNCVYVSPAAVETMEPPLPVLEDGYSEKSVEIATYLTTLARPPTMTTKEFLKFKKEALLFKVQDRILFRRNSKNVPIRRVVDRIEDQMTIMEELHDESGHKGREGTYRRIADRYWWNGMFQQVKKYVQTCVPCQHRDPTRPEEELHPTWTSELFARVAVDVVYMPSDAGFTHLVVGRCDLSGWVEARPLRGATSEQVAKFLWEDFVCRHGCFGKLIVDGGPENKGYVQVLAEKYNIKRVLTSAYHPQANGMVERGHRPIVDALAKMGENKSLRWVSNLAAVLWADRSTVKTSTAITPYRMLFGQDPVLPIELKFPTWRILPWETVRTTADLLALRARQMQRRDKDMAEAVLHLERMRKEGKDAFDASHRTRTEDLKIGDRVLMHDTPRFMNRRTENKLAYRWTGPYLILEALPILGTYVLGELDGTLLKGTYAGNRLKSFHSRQLLVQDEIVSQGTTEAFETGGEVREITEQELQEAIPNGWRMAVVIPPVRTAT